MARVIAPATEGTSCTAARKSIRSFHCLHDAAPSWCRRLHRLDLSYNKLRQVCGLETFAALRSLNLYFNDISDINELERLGQALPQLQELDIRMNPIARHERCTAVLRRAFPCLVRLNGSTVSVDDSDSDAQRHAAPSRVQSCCAFADYASDDAVDISVLLEDGTSGSMQVTLRAHVQAHALAARKTTSASTRVDHTVEQHADRAPPAVAPLQPRRYHSTLAPPTAVTQLPQRTYNVQPPWTPSMHAHTRQQYSAPCRTTSEIIARLSAAVPVHVCALAQLQHVAAPAVQPAPLPVPVPPVTPALPREVTPVPHHVDETDGVSRLVGALLRGKTPAAPAAVLRASTASHETQTEEAPTPPAAQPAAVAPTAAAAVSIVATLASEPAAPVTAALVPAVDVLRDRQLRSAASQRQGRSGPSRRAVAADKAAPPPPPAVVAIMQQRVQMAQRLRSRDDPPTHVRAALRYSSLRASEPQWNAADDAPAPVAQNVVELVALPDDCSGTAIEDASPALCVDVAEQMVAQDAVALPRASRAASRGSVRTASRSPSRHSNRTRRASASIDSHETHAPASTASETPAQPQASRERRRRDSQQQAAVMVQPPTRSQEVLSRANLLRSTLTAAAAAERARARSHAAHARAQPLQVVMSTTEEDTDSAAVQPSFASDSGCAPVLVLPSDAAAAAAPTTPEPVKRSSSAQKTVTSSLAITPSKRDFADLLHRADAPVQLLEKAGGEPWQAFARAQMDTLMMLREAYGRVLSSYDDTKAQLASLTSEIALQRSSHEASTATLNSELLQARTDAAAKDAEIARLRAANDEYAHAAREQQERADGMQRTLRDEHTVHLQEVQRWRGAFEELRLQFTAMTAICFPDGTPRTATPPASAVLPSRGASGDVTVTSTTCPPASSAHAPHAGMNLAPILEAASANSTSTEDVSIATGKLLASAKHDARASLGAAVGLQVSGL